MPRLGGASGAPERESVRSSRPQFAPGYGISADAAGMLDWSWATERLSASRNYWIVTSGADGSPHAMPVWGLWFDDAVVFGTSAESRKGRNLARDPRVVVHLESGDDVVILEGRVERIALDDAIADAYGAKYEFRPDPGQGGDGWFRLRPSIAYAWREQDYPSSATRFSFD
jgi:PPOX class probable F420-dependent enzyme